MNDSKMEKSKRFIQIETELIMKIINDEKWLLGERVHHHVTDEEVMEKVIHIIEEKHELIEKEATESMEKIDE